MNNLKKEAQQFYVDLGDDVFSSSLQWLQEAEDQQLRLLVDNVPFTELPLAPDEKILYRSRIINNFEGRIQSTEVVLKCPDGNLIVHGQYDRKSDKTKKKCQNRQKFRKIKNLKNFDFPIPSMILEY